MYICQINYYLGTVGNVLKIWRRMVKKFGNLNFTLLSQTNWCSPIATFTPPEIQNLTVAGAIKRGRKEEGEYIKHFQQWIKMYKIRIFCWWTFFDICLSFWINRHHIKLNVFFQKNLYLRNQLVDLDQFFSYHCKIKNYMILLMTCFRYDPYL